MLGLAASARRNAGDRQRSTVGTMTTIADYRDVVPFPLAPQTLEEPGSRST